MKKTLLIIGIISTLYLVNYAQKLESKFDNAFSLETTYISDQVTNFTGGIKTGYSYLGMVNINIGFETEKAGWWKGGSFFVHAANTHGDTPSADLIGDTHVASNIEAGDHTYIQEMWFQQSLGKIDVIVGLQDLNTEFTTSDNGGVYLNSSFGIMPILSGNMPAPIFPLTNLGLTLKWHISNNTTWQNAIYEGMPNDFENNNTYNLNWEYNKGDGTIGITELQQSVNLSSYSGTYKLGLFSYNHLLENDLPDSINQTIWGIYAHGDQVMWEENEKNIGLFVHAGYSPSDASTNNFYAGGGINLTGFISNKKDDILGIAVAHAHYSDIMEGETIIELTWQKPLGNYFFIQPDFQYIINPCAELELNNSFAGILRFGLTF